MADENMLERQACQVGVRREILLVCGQAVRSQKVPKNSLNRKEESLCLVPGRFWLKKTLGKLVSDPATNKV